MSQLRDSIKILLGEHHQDNLSSLFDSSKEKDIVVFLGSTGSGKSTLINYLNDKEMFINDDKEFQIKDPNDPTCMEIGMNGSVQRDSLVFYDLPGFDDNRGTATNLVNASFIKNIIENAKSVRLVFVGGYDEITASRGASFKKLLKFTEILVNKDSAYGQSSLLIVTKSDKNTSEELVQFLSQKIHETEDLQTWLNPDRCLPMSRKIDTDQKDQIIKSIINTTPSKIKKVNIEAILNTDVTNDLRQIFQLEMTSSLEKISNNYPKNQQNIPDINQSIQFYKNSFEINVMNEISASYLIKLLTPLSENIYLEEVGKFLIQVKQFILMNVSILDAVKQRFEKEIVERQAVEKQRQQAETIERQRQEQIRQAEANRRLMEQAVEQQRQAAEQQRQQAAVIQMAIQQQKNLEKQIEIDQQNTRNQLKQVQENIQQMTAMKDQEMARERERAKVEIARLEAEKLQILYRDNDSDSDDGCNIQ